MLKTASGRGYRLLGEWMAATSPESPFDRDARLAAKASRPRPSQVPRSVSELIGRSDTIQRLLALMSAYRIVTLTGPGGIGKTRLALDVARRLADDFRDGACIIELAPLAAPWLLPSAIATALSLTFHGDKITEASIARAIGEQQVLLLLDNCEHLVDSVAKMAETLASACPNVTIIATSREPLRVAGERIYRVPALALPPDGAAGSADLLQHAAVQLFVARAKASGLEFGLKEADLKFAAAICRRLDGIPLAIEFAAARAAALGLGTVHSALEDRFTLLAGGRRTALPRHQTMRATLDWSYNLLSDVEKRMLNRLSVFAGGFTLEGTGAVMGDAGVDRTDIAVCVSQLIEKSWISTEGEQHSGRWHLLETIRAYANDNLAAAGETQQTALQHATFFCGLVERRLSFSIPGVALTYCGREISNVRAALDWAFSDAGDAGIGARLTAAYVPVWLHLVLVPECRDAIERALARGGSRLEPRVTMQLNIALGQLLSYLPEPVTRRTQDILMQALEIAEGLDDFRSQVLALWGIWTLRMKEGDHRAGLAVAHRIRDAAMRSGNAADSAVGYRAVGTSYHYSGNQRAAQQAFAAVLDLPASVFREDHQAWLLTDLRIQSQAMLARVLLLRGLVAEAHRQALASFDAARAADHGLSICFTLRYGLWAVELVLGNLPAAEAAVRTMVEIATARNFNLWQRQGRCLAAMIAIRRGDYPAGTLQLKAAIDDSINVNFSLGYSEMLGALVEGLLGTGEYGEALAILRTAIDWSERSGERWYLAELLHLEGELALKAPDLATVDAEAAFRRAVEVAHEQGAFLWELRAACALARLRLNEQRPDQARQILAPVCACLEGQVAWPDLSIARELLAQLSAPGAGSR
jgi:predicted ATPase